MIPLPRQAAVGRAHSKLILLGEHSVVYGKPAIALPFPLVQVESVVEAVSDALLIDCEYYLGPLSAVPDKLRGLAACVTETLKLLEKPAKGLLIRLVSSIPPERGLGSSAAVAVALVRSLFAFHGRETAQSELLALAHIAETYAHGTPSGIDTAAISADYPLWFRKGEAPQPLSIGAQLHLVVADSGRASDTRSAVMAVKERFAAEWRKTNQFMVKLEKIADDARAALSLGDSNRLGKLLDSAHNVLQALGVSDAGLNRLVEAARKAGALGAKLTGGGRGGCILTLAQDSGHAATLSQALSQAGASRTWYFKLDKEVET